ncbi:MAG: TonB-dependent receptor plug domain-containing protein [Bacteroidetes bacterium]|nr:TonB-dependent receptor plug domain-containing protein [Bacteroidota bacterium]
MKNILYSFLTGLQKLFRKSYPKRYKTLSQNLANLLRLGILAFLFLFIFIGKTIAQKDTIPEGEKEIIKLPVFTLSDTDLDGYDESQDISGLLQSSRDIFVSTAGYTFGSARYRIRGYGSENFSVLINGIPVNDVESGRAYWSSWGGLNDALRNQDIKTGIVASPFTFGGIGGVTNIETRASKYRQGVKLTYSLANRSYRNRLMFLASTGLMNNGWAVTVSGSRRWAQEGYVEGTFYDAWSYFVSVEKKINNSHSIGFVAYGTPNKRGKAGVSTQEAYDLAGTNYYNAYWGFQNGEKRNSRIGNYHQPLMMLTDYWKINDKTKLTSTLSYSFGRGGSTALNWVEAGDPRPDYYKHLPSYFYYLDDISAYNYYREQWQNNENFRQINWDHFYFANSKYLYTVNNVEGIQGNDVTGFRSKYIIEDRRNDISRIGFNMTLNKDINENTDISGGLNMTWFKGFHFKEIVDLLGGEYWLDIDKYANQEPFEITGVSQSDLRHPNRIVTTGDRFGYDYTSNINSYNIFAQGDFTYNMVDFYLAVMLSYTQFWRTGNMQNGRFPDESLGDSEKQNFFNYGLKGGLSYKINGRNYINVNGEYLTRAPYFRNSYISPRTRDYIISNLESETVYSGDISYILRTSVIKSRLTFYYTQFVDQTWARSFYHDDLNTFVNYLMTGVNKQNKGVELGIEANVTPTVTLSLVAGKGQFIYNSRPKVTIAQDNDAKIIAENRTVYLKNYYVGGMPQTIGSFGFKYNSPKYWFAGISINYFDDIYLDINPERRTAEAVRNFSSEDIRAKETLEQEKLASAMTVDVYGGKSWKIGDYYIGLNVSISNLLNNTDFASGGFEQLRYDPENVYKFPPRYFYLYGLTYFINLNFRF